MHPQHVAFTLTPTERDRKREIERERERERERETYTVPSACNKLLENKVSTAATTGEEKGWGAIHGIQQIANKVSNI